MGKCCKGENLKNRSTWSHFFQNCKTSYLYGSFSRASKTVSINLFVVQAGQINRRLFWLLNILASTEMQLMGNETLSSLSRLDHFIHKNKDMEKNNRGQLFSLFPGPTRGYNAAINFSFHFSHGLRLEFMVLRTYLKRFLKVYDDSTVK